jgi:hypothetical protein
LTSSKLNVEGTTAKRELVVYYPKDGLEIFMVRDITVWFYISLYRIILEVPQ